MTVQYFRRGSRLIEDATTTTSMSCARAPPTCTILGTLVDRGGEGACFGSITLTQGNPSTFDVTAREDTLALVLPADDFHRLCADHPDFDAFFDAQQASRMSGAVTLGAAVEHGWGDPQDHRA